MSAIPARKLWQGAFLALAIGAILAVFLVLTIPPEVAGQSGTPAKPTGLRVTTTDGSLEVSVDWNDVSGATSNTGCSWREHGRRESSLNTGITVTDSSATITVADSGEWIVRVEACTEDGCGRGAAKRFEVSAAEPEETPTPTPTATPTPEPTLTLPDRIELTEGETYNSTGLPALAPDFDNRVRVKMTHLGDDDVVGGPWEFWIERGNYDFNQWPNFQITARPDADTGRRHNLVCV